MRSVRALALAAVLAPCVATTALAQQDPQPPPATDPSALPPLPPPPAEPSRPTPPANTTVDGALRSPLPPVPPTPPTLPARPDEPERRWYGWQIILTDGAALASVLASANGSGWGDLALALYLGGGPVVHFAHRNLAKGAGSLALRVLAPLGGALMGALVGAMAEGNGSGSGETSPALEGAGLGVVGGLLGASIVDVAVLAYDVVPAGSRAGSGSEAPRLRLAPVATLPRDSTGRVAPTFGLSGSF